MKVMRLKMLFAFVAVFFGGIIGPLSAQPTKIPYKNTFEIEPLFEILQLYHIKYLRAISNHFEIYTNMKLNMRNGPAQPVPYFLKLTIFWRRLAKNG